MGLFDVLGGILFEAVMLSDSKVGNATRKTAKFLAEEDAAIKKRVLITAQEKAYKSGNKELVERIKEERKKY